MTEAMIRLRLSEIEYDVKFDTWGKANVGEKPDEKLLYKGGKMQDWLLRQIENSVGEILGKLRWCAHDHAHMVDNEILDAPDYWEIRLRWRGLWHGSETALKSYAHQYIVQNALAEWYTMKGVHAEAYMLKAATALENLVKSARKTSTSTPTFRL